MTTRRFAETLYALVVSATITVCAIMLSGLGAQMEHGVQLAVDSVRPTISGQASPIEPCSTREEGLFNRCADLDPSRFDYLGSEQ